MNEPVTPARGLAPILDVEGLVVRYGTRTAVDGVSLQIARGEIFGLLGPNGAGKTSTLSAIEGLLKPTAGTVLVDGIDIHGDPLAAKARLGVQLAGIQFSARTHDRGDRPPVRGLVRPENHETRHCRPDP